MTIAFPPRAALRFATRCLPLLLSTAVLAATSGRSAHRPSPPTLRIPLVSSKWRTHGSVTFGTQEGFAAGLAKVGGSKGDEAVLLGPGFGEGTIEFDMKAQGDGMPGVKFRYRDAGSAELLYLRTQPDCPVETDCIQYVPIVHGVMPWNMYPQYQHSAPVAVAGWNHYRLVVSGRRMAVYVNRAPAVVLAIGRLEGDAGVGAIALEGPAEFANLTIAPNADGSLPANAEIDPSLREGRYLRHWRVSPSVPTPLDRMPTYSQRPADGRQWRRVTAERYGVINLSRLYGSPTDARIGALAWLTTDLRSPSARHVHVDMGFLSEASVYLNGRLVFSGWNQYYPPKYRRVPDGRLCVTNAAFDLPLRKGANRIDVALNNILGVGHAHYGWGLAIRLGGRHDGRADDGCSAG
jgi:hypothetical protein